MEARCHPVTREAHILLEARVQPESKQPAGVPLVSSVKEGGGHGGKGGGGWLEIERGAAAVLRYSVICGVAYDKMRAIALGISVQFVQYLPIFVCAFGAA